MRRHSGFHRETNYPLTHGRADLETGAPSSVALDVLYHLRHFHRTRNDLHVAISVFPLSHLALSVRRRRYPHESGNPVPAGGESDLCAHPGHSPAVGNHSAL